MGGDHDDARNGLRRPRPFGYASYQGVMNARPSVWLKRLNPRNAGVAPLSRPSDSVSTAWTTNMYRCRPVPAGGAAPMYRAMRASFGSWKLPRGSLDPVSSPAPVGSSVTLAGMSTTAQCQKPLPVGASGSNVVTTNLRVPSWKPLQDNCRREILAAGSEDSAELRQWHLLAIANIGALHSERGHFRKIFIGIPGHRGFLL